MHKIVRLVPFAAALLLVATPVVAQQPAAPVVKFEATADMPSVKDNTKRDAFGVGLSDAQIVTAYRLSCQAGRTKLGGLVRVERGCQVSGNGSVVAPGGATKPRVQYQGGYLVKSDGSTDASTIAVEYLALGKVPASSAKFGGMMTLKPELTSTGAAQLKEVVLKQLKSDSEGLIDDRTDTIDLNRLIIPSAGLPSDTGVTWNGNMVYAYQTESWYINATAFFGGKEYKLKGNMAWSETAGVDGQTQYDLTLTIPGQNDLGDAALFSSATDNSDLFATVDGISGQIIMKEGSNVMVMVDGKETKTPTSLTASGTFTGTNVPLEVVRSFATIIAINSSGFFGG